MSTERTVILKRERGIIISNIAAVHNAKQVECGITHISEQKKKNSKNIISNIA
jgi:hypothetical protein